MTAGDNTGRRNWQRVAIVALVILFFIVGCLIFLVLTGIIAEPETLIESILRAVID